MKNAIDLLIEKIKTTNNPTVIGLDPRYDILPNCIKEKYPATSEGACDAILEFNKAIIDATCDIVPAILRIIYEMQVRYIDYGIIDNGINIARLRQLVA